MYLEKYDLSNRIAVITGGGRNIGLACAHALAEAGAKIIIAEIDPEVAAVGHQEMTKAGFESEVLQLDVTNPADVNAAADQVVNLHGRVDILVCNAGVAFNTPAEEMPGEEWLKVIDINLNGVFWCCRAFGRHMLKAGKGSIINIGSMSGIISNKPQPQCHYNASKAAVHMLTKSLAAEWADRGVRVNAVAPTYIETAMTRRGMDNPIWLQTWLEMTPMSRVGQPPEIASVVLFLASDASSLMTGSIVVADGGYTCW
ncbi:MAG TPA: SDR family oxidoreductase [Blastocatellia bacterium]|nr:SDR family oxidoreductase [Blastocatellia bacterium]